MISIAQIRAGRGLLGWSKTKLAEKAKLSLPLVKRYEDSQDRDIPEDAIAALQHALEAGGIEFLDGQSGVRMKAPAATLPLEQLNASNDE